MGATLKDTKSSTLCAGADALHSGAFINKSFTDGEFLGIHAVVIRRISHRTRERFAHGFASCLRGEPQHGLGIVGFHPTNEINNPTCLHGRHADVPRLGPGFHRFPLASRYCYINKNYLVFRCPPSSR